MLYNKAIGATASAQKIYIEDAFSTYLYTGNGSTQTITNGIDLSGKGGLVWLKARTAAAAADHVFADTTRGASNYLSSNTTSAQIDDSSNINGFTSSGFSVNLGARVNQNANNYVSWTFRKAAKFFDVVTWVGNGTVRQISHSLNSVPGCIIVKRTDTAGFNWIVYHRSLGSSKYLTLETTGAEASSSFIWNATDPTSSNFTVGNTTSTNVSGGTYVAYLFAHDAGGFGNSGNDNVISCGSYTGNGSTSGPTVTLGWEPQWLVIKRTDAAGGWFIFDSIRGITTSGNDPYLRAESDAAEFTTANDIRLEATGFGINSTSGSINASGGNFIYIAIRRGPMKTPTDATKVFSAITATGGSGTTRTVGFPADLYLATRRAEAFGFFSQDRLRGFEESDTTGKPILYTASTAAEVSNQNPFAYQIWNTSARDGSQGLGSSNLWYYLRRAPGFFDVVAYTGNGSSSQSISHNLGVLPNLVIIKSRSLTTGWSVFWGASSPLTGYMSLNSSAADSSNDTLTASSSSFTAELGIGNGLNTNAATYIAYLFATCPGVSKCFNYTGTGTTKQIDCGFTNGARFVLIKRTDSTGDWYVWDTARGIVSGNDPYLLLNSTAAEVTNTDYIDPLSSGFEISSTAPAAINANGGSYIFLAIA